jgi:hypothetical protein
MKFYSRLLLAFVISFTLSGSPIIQSANAGSMISTSTVVDHLSRDVHEQNISTFLSRDDVKNQLVKMGVSGEEAQRRLASLSDREVKKLSGEVDHAIAGGDIGGILIIIVLVLLIIYLFKRV